MAELDPKTREHLQGLCRQITVAHELDPEIQEELYGHMEDKLLAYLSGEERVSEQDAFVLVREHFGDPAVLKGLLRDAHPREARVTYARRLLAAFVLFLTVDVVVKIVTAIVGAAGVWYTYGHGRDWSSYIQVYPQLMFPLNWASVVVICLVLIRWNRRTREGRSIYLFRAPLPHVISMVALLLLMYALTPDLRFTRALAPDAAGREITEVFFYFYSSIGVGLSFMLWLWWCDRPPRTTKAMLWGLGAGCAWVLARGSSILTGVSYLCFVERGGHTMRDFSHTLTSGHVGGTSWDWFLLVLPTQHHLFNASSMLFHLQYHAPYALVACGLYAAARWAVKRVARDSGTDRPGYG
ncbi:MAG: hypothetical protein HZB26_24555 [Candidatus Hydrogenedentes bacterium]|nr:hypothetical protein [Candidatus Hydrogenedentota bacterium]